VVVISRSQRSGQQLHLLRLLRQCPCPLQL